MMNLALLFLLTFCINAFAGISPPPASANSILPSQTGNSGKFLTTDGSSTSWGTAGGGARTLYFYQGYIPTSATNHYETTSTSYADYTIIGTPALTAQTNTNFGTVTISTSNKPGIKVASAPYTGWIKVTVILPTGCYNVGTGCDHTIELVEINSSTVIDQRVSTHTQTLNNFVATMGTMSGYFAVTAASAYEFRIQGLVNSGSTTGYIGDAGSSGDGLQSVKFIMEQPY